MSPGDAREAIEDRLLDDDFTDRLLRGDRHALNELSQLFAIAWPDGDTNTDVEDRGDEDRPFDGMSPVDAKRRVELARTDERFRKRLTSGDRAARRRMRRLQATTDPERRRGVGQ